MPTDIEDILKKALKLGNIQLATSKYLEDEKAEIIRAIMSRFLNKNEYYTNSIKKEKESFEHSIVYGHFKWVINNINNPAQKSLDFYKEYILFDYDVYCDFYTETINHFNNKSNLSEDMRKIIIKQFNLVKEYYCPN